MSKYHINKNGVPAVCKAKEGNCPLGGESGNDNHYGSKEEAQEAADKINKEEHGLLPNISKPSPSSKAINIRRDLFKSIETFKGKHVKVEYDGKSYQGEVKEAYLPSDNKNQPGIIIRGHDEHGAEEFKHIKLDRIESMADLDGNGPQGMLKHAIDEGSVYGVIDGNEYVDGKEGLHYKEHSLISKDNNVLNASKRYDFYKTKEEAQAEVDRRNDVLNDEKSKSEEVKSNLDNFSKSNFYKKPKLSDEVLDKHKEDLAKMEDDINHQLNKRHGFEGVQFLSHHEGTIRIAGHHKDIKGYYYGGDIIIKEDFSNKDEAVANFVEMWESEDTEEKISSEKSFIKTGETLGWD